ncbi:MAG: fused MFS/spermidine synthase [Austwickia sp.]|nr:fused MFS/spermidine synthase [Austwickia sp.]
MRRRPRVGAGGGVRRRAATAALSAASGAGVIPATGRGPERVDLHRAGSVTTVVVDGHPQSHVNLHDPTDLGFEYLLQLAVVLDTLDPHPPAPLSVTHIGGAGLSLPRFLAVRRPGSPQIVLEPDETVTAIVRRELPLPRGHRIRVRPTDGRSGLAGLKDGSARVVVLDAYHQGRVPAELTTAEAFTGYARVVGPDGLLLANLADEPGLSYVARVAAAARGAGFPSLLLIGNHEILKGRRFGNVVLAASASALDDQAVATALARRALGAGLRDVAATARWARSARAFTDDDCAPSPPAPDPGRWRVR